MALSEKEELERLRAIKKNHENYANTFAKENYRKYVCVYPKANSDRVDEAIRQSGEKSISAYITTLINNDLRKRGLID